MSKVITFSRTFPSYHPKKGMSTGFVYTIWMSLPEYDTKYRDIMEQCGIDCTGAYPKYHTIRSGNRWKVGDKFSPRVWSGLPYRSKQIIICPDIEVKKVWDFKIKDTNIWINDNMYVELNEAIDKTLLELAKNDGLSYDDLLHWLKHPSDFSGQIICWNENIEY